MKKIFVIVFFLITCIIISACTHIISDNDFETILTVPTSSETTLEASEIRTAKYNFELHGDVVLSPGYSGTYLNGRIECTVTCVSGRDYYEGGNPVDPARAWLIMPDGTKYSAANPAPPEGALVDVKAGDTIKTTLSFSHLPLDFAPGEYDILVSEYDDSTGEGDYSKKLFEKVTVRFETE